MKAPGLSRHSTSRASLAKRRQSNVVLNMLLVVVAVDDERQNASVSPTSAARPTRKCGVSTSCPGQNFEQRQLNFIQWWKRNTITELLSNR